MTNGRRRGHGVSANSGAPLLSSTGGRCTTRRQVLRGGVGLLGALTLAACGRGGGGGDDATPQASVVTTVHGYGDPERWKDRDLVVTSWGGEYQRAQERAIFEPFQRLTGATIRREFTDIQQLREQVEDDSTAWDVCDVLQEDVLSLANLGVIAPIDSLTIDLGDLVQGAVQDFAVASSYSATVMAARTDAWENGAVPQSWAEFWDAGRFPGLRGLQRRAEGTLEFALLSDGVAVHELYPLDVERALARIDALWESVGLWWEQGAQPAQLLNADAIALTSVWNSRVERGVADDAPVTTIWHGAAIDGDAWVMPRGARNADVALDFIKFATRPEVCAAFCASIPFGPVNRNAFDFLPEERGRELPTWPENLEHGFLVDHAWWFKHRERVQAEFDAWYADHPSP